MEAFSTSELCFPTCMSWPFPKIFSFYSSWFSTSIHDAQTGETSGKKKLPAAKQTAQQTHLRAALFV